MTKQTKQDDTKKRGRKRVNKRYFTDITEIAIVAYNGTEDNALRNKIYSRFIKYPFEKLAENMIHTFKFYHFDVPYEDVQHEVVAFLNEKIDRYKKENGKAFSYFSIVAKNYLIIKNNNNYNRWKNTYKLDALDNSRNVVNEVKLQDHREEKSDFMDLFVEHFDRNLSKYFTREKDVIVADAVLHLFRSRHNIENYNKKALYILIRERTGVKTQYITKVVNILKEKYAEMFEVYRRTGALIDNTNRSFF